MRQQKSQLNNGTVIADRYQISEPLELGLNGEFYRAISLGTPQRCCSLERLDLGASASSAAIAKIHRIVRDINRIEHPNLAKIEEVLSLSDRSIVLIRKSLSGQSLALAIREDEAWSWRRAFFVVLQIAQGLKVLHQCRHFHGNLRLEHVLRGQSIGLEEQITVIDLGFDRILVGLREGMVQVVKSTCSYSSPYSSHPRSHPVPSMTFDLGLVPLPEKMLRVSSKSVGTAAGMVSDILGIGDMFYTLISGKPIRSSRVISSESDAFIRTAKSVNSDFAISEEVCGDGRTSYFRQSARSLPKLSDLDLPAQVERIIYRCWEAGNEAGYAGITPLINEMRDALELDCCRVRAEATTRPESLPVAYEQKLRMRSH